MHAVALLAPPSVPLHELYSMVPVVFLVKFQAHDFVQVFQARGWQCFQIHMHTMFMMM